MVKSKNPELYIKTRDAFDKEYTKRRCEPFIIEAVAEKEQKIKELEAKNKNLNEALDKRIEDMFVSLDTARNKALLELKEKIIADEPKYQMKNFFPEVEFIRVDKVIELIEKEMR
jgi:hypothetical protein